MTKRRKISLWVGIVLSLPAAGYAGMGFVFYAWLSAAEPERWPADKAALWAYSALALSILFFGLFVYCLVSLIKEANREYRVEEGFIQKT
jgi:hypothetical protein